MQIIPAIDLMDSKVVRLTKGIPETRKSYLTGSSLETAIRWSEAGAKLLHLIDLDAALGRGSNRSEILNIIKSINIDVQVGGGIRDKRDVATLLDNGAYRVLLGSFALSHIEEAAELLDEYGGERIAIVLDHRFGRVLARGWTEDSGYTLLESLERYINLGFKWFLVTDVDRDGALSGPSIEIYKRIGNYASIIASGGISQIDDLLKLRDTGVHAVVIGKALYEGHFTYQEAVKAMEDS